MNTTNRRACGAERRTSQLVSSKVFCRFFQDSDSIAGMSVTLGVTVIKDRVRVSSDDQSRNFGIHQFSGTIRAQSVSLRGEGQVMQYIPNEIFSRSEDASTRTLM